VEPPGHGKFPLAIDVVLPMTLPDFGPISRSKKGAVDTGTGSGLRPKGGSAGTSDRMQKGNVRDGGEDEDGDNYVYDDDDNNEEDVPEVNLMQAPASDREQPPNRIPSGPIDEATGDPGCGSDSELFAFEGAYASREDRMDDTLAAAYTPPTAKALEDYPQAFKMQITVCADQGFISFVPRFVLKEFAPLIGLTIDSIAGRPTWAALDVVPRPPTNAPICLRIIGSRLRALVPPRCDLDGSPDGDREMTGHPAKDGGTRPGADASLPRPTMLLAAARSIRIGLFQRVGSAQIKPGVRPPSSRRVEEARAIAWDRLAVDVDAALAEAWSVEGHPADPLARRGRNSSERVRRNAMRILAAERMSALRVP